MIGCDDVFGEAGHAVDVAGLRKTYGDTSAVDGVSFSVAEGQIFGLLGPNGSGKTTTVECLQGLRRADAGQITVFGHDVRTDPAAVRKIVGSQLQDSALPERMRVWEALRLFSVISPGSARAAGAPRRPWQDLLEEWGLADRRNAAFGDLSGGQRQRLFVAIALIADPRLVVLDEMTTGLDPAARRVTWDLVDAVRRRGTTVVLVTHFMDEAERLCDRLAVMVHGHIVATGTPTDLVAATHPARAVLFTAATGADLAFLRGVPGVDDVRRDAVGPNGTLVRVTGTGPLLARVAHALVGHGVEPVDLRGENPSLEDAYLALTQAGEP